MGYARQRARKKNPITAGLALLRRLGDRASVFAPGVGQPVGPVNRLLWSSNLMAGWTAGGSGSTILDATSVTLSASPTSQVAQGTNSLTAAPYTYAALVSVDSGTRNVRLKHWDGTTDNFTPNLQVSTTPTLLVMNTTGTTFAATNVAVCNDTAATPGKINVLAQGLFLGTYTAAEIQALGGIPTTTTAPAAARYTPWINGASLSPTAGTDTYGPERFVNPIIATNTWTDQGNGVYYCKANVWGNLGMSVASGSVPALLGGNQRVRVRVTITGAFTNMYLWSAIDSSGSNNASVYSFPGPGVYDFTVTTAAYGGLWFDSATGTGATLSAISFQQVIAMPAAPWFQTYLDSAASSATAVDSPVGFLSDGEGTVGPELATNGNGGFPNAVGWFLGSGISISGGVMTFSGVANNGNGQFYAPLTSGKTYRLSITVKSISGGTAALLISGGAGINGITAPGTYITTVAATGSGSFYVWASGASNNSFVVSSISLCEVTGRHATQGTGSAKPVLRRGLVNLVLNSATNPYSANGGGGSVVNITSPSTGVAQIEKTGSGGYAEALARPGAPNGVTLTITSACQVRVVSGSAADVFFGLEQDLPPFAVNMTSLASLGVANDGGWYDVAYTGSIATNSTNIRAASFMFNVSASVTIQVRQAGAFLGSYTLQQIKALGGIPLTMGVAASSALGNYALEFNGSSSMLPLNSAPFSASEDHLVVGGALAPKRGAYNAIFGAGGGGSQRCAHIGFTDTGMPYAQWQDDAAVNVSHVGAAVTPGTPVVLVARQVAGIRSGFVNDVFLGSSATALGTTTLVVPKIGAASSGNSDFFSGLIYVVIVVRGAISDAEVRVLRRFVAALTGPIPNALKF